MKYVVTMNGKKYEVEVERMSAFHMLTREEIASGAGSEGSSADSGSGGTGSGSEGSGNPGSGSGTGGKGSARRHVRDQPDARLRARRQSQCRRQGQRRPDHVRPRGNEDGE